VNGLPESYEDYRLSEAGDTFHELPLLHREGLDGAAQLSDIAGRVYNSQDLVGPGLKAEWEGLAGQDAQGKFAAAYEGYVDSPLTLKETMPEVYAFMRDHIFNGTEYLEPTDLYQVEAAIAELSSMSEISPPVWQSLSPGDKVAVLQHVENMLAQNAGRPARLVMAEDMDENQGGYCADDGLHINSRWIDHPAATDSIETVVHEARHAGQRFCAQAPGVYNDRATAMAWADNLMNYKSVELYGFQAYYDQPVEKDARDFADAVVAGVKGVMEYGT